MTYDPNLDPAVVPTRPRSSNAPWFIAGAVAVIAIGAVTFMVVNSNNSANQQGTGTTIVKIVPNSNPVVFLDPSRSFPTMTTRFAALDDAIFQKNPGVVKDLDCGYRQAETGVVSDEGSRTSLLSLCIMRRISQTANVISTTGASGNRTRGAIIIVTGSVQIAISSQ